MCCQMGLIGCDILQVAQKAIVSKNQERKVHPSELLSPWYTLLDKDILRGQNWKVAKRGLVTVKAGKGEKVNVN